MAHLATATEKSDRLVVVYGVDGSGKTTLLSQYINSIGDDTCFVAIDETCNGEKQFYCSFLRQIGFGDITGTSRELRSITKEFLVQRGMAGDPVLMIIDNAHLVSPMILEQLRWISAIKVKDRRVLSVVLAGNSDLARVMESPAMTQIEFHDSVNFNIRVYSETETSNYVCHHLKLAGGVDALEFPNEAQALIYRYTGGIPNLINVLCNAVLAEAHARESHAITEELVREVADSRRLSPHVIPLLGRGRRKTDLDCKPVQPGQQDDECIDARDSTTNGPAGEATQTFELPDIDGENLLERIGELSEQVGELRADRMRALQDVGARDKDISELRNMLDEKTAEVERLASALGDSADEIVRLNQTLSDSAKASQKKEKKLKKLAADLKLANERVAEHDDLEKKMAAVADNNEKTTGELLALRDEVDTRDAALGDLEKLLQESQSEITSLRSRAAALESLEESVSEKDAHIASLSTELETHIQEIMALEAKYEDLESRGTEMTDAEWTPTPESELQEVGRMLTETQAQVSGSTASRSDSLAEQRGAAIVAFEVSRDGEAEQILDVAAGQSRFVIGRSEDNELRLDSKYVSRHHALVQSTEQGFYIEDLNSYNGTIVNSRKINRCDLRPGDLVEIGNFQIKPK